MLSDVGVEFLATFGASREAHVVKEMRKLYISYKQRDSLLLESKKSILYSLILKTMTVVFQTLSDSKVMRIADATMAELEKELAASEEGGLDRFKPTIFAKIETFARVRVCQQLLKNFQSAIMMTVTHGKGPLGPLLISKPLDELAYLKFIEDLCRFSFQSAATYPMLSVVKTALHRSFMSSPKFFETVANGVKTCVERLKEDPCHDWLAFCADKVHERTTAKPQD